MIPLADPLQRIADALERLSPLALNNTDWGNAIAFRWRKQAGGGRTQGYLQAVQHVAALSLDALHHIDSQKERIVQNTAQFVAKLPANNVLLTGARGTGKSSLIRACLHHFAAQGLRLVEIDKDDLTDLPDLVDLVSGLPERFVVFCDDLSFDEGESGYKALKSMLDGTISAPGDNVLIVATSNRRHLLPEFHSDNQGYKHTADGELHPGETVEEKISLSDRFGLWLSFYPFPQDDYLSIVSLWLAHWGLNEAEQAQARPEALIWAIERGSRSGRIAYQFARDYAGQRGATASNT